MDAAQEFAVRYYRWAARDSIEELEAGFPLVSRLANENAVSYLSVMNSQDADTRRRLVAASVKRFHPQAVDLLNHALTPEEEDLLEWADGTRFEMKLNMPMPALRVSTRRLKAALSRELLALTGQQTPLPKVGPKTYRFEFRHDPWSVQTWFDCGRRPEYFHHIKRGETALATFLSMASWMGIASVTSWTLKSAGSEKEIAKTMVEATQRFLDRLPELLEGLDK